MNQDTIYPFSLEFNSLLQCPRCKDGKFRLMEKARHVECSNCRAQFPIIEGMPLLLPDQDALKKTREDWARHNKAAEHYDEIPLHHFWDAEGSPIGKYIKEGILAKEKETIEVGAGVGTIARYLLHNAGLRTKCIDIAPGSLKHVKALQLPALLATNFMLPLKDNIADRVISYGVIHHTPNPALCMKELSRILKTGGYLILVLFRKWSFYHFWFLAYAPIPRMLRRILGRRLGDLFIYPYYVSLYYIPFWLGLAVYHRKLRPPKLKDVWSTFNDQFLSPNESYHTIQDVKRWAADNDLTVEDHFNFCRPGGGALSVLLRKR